MQRVSEAYARGMQIVASLKDLDGPNVNPVCHTRIYSHGHRTERALVLLHGFTNCPQQFDVLGRRFHERGYHWAACLLATWLRRMNGWSAPC